MSIVLMARYLSRAGHPIMNYFIWLAFSWHPANKNSDTIIWLLWICMWECILYGIQYLYKGNEMLRQVTLDRSTELSRARNWRGRGDLLYRNSSYLYSRYKLLIYHHHVNETLLSKMSTHKLHGYFCLLVQTSNKTWQTIAILAFLCWPLEYCSLMAKQYLTMPLKTSQMVSSLINS